MLEKRAVWGKNDGSLASSSMSPSSSLAFQSSFSELSLDSSSLRPVFFLMSRDVEGAEPATVTVSRENATLLDVERESEVMGGESKMIELRYS